MNGAACCHGHGGRRPVTRTKAASFLVSGLGLLLMPKCPVCVAAYVTLLTGLSVSTAAARQLHAVMIFACGGVLALVVVNVARGVWRRKLSTPRGPRA